ncbi:hypothetical protein ACROYT_G015523 [Oculina patagonica]
MPAKPTKYGIKVWMAADSQNGYVNNFSVYLGKEADTPRNNGLGSDVVKKMASPFLKMHSVCCNAPEVAGKNQFLTGCSSTKKETMQKHAISKNHMCAQAAVLAKQKPVRETVVAQSFSKGRKDQEEKDRRAVAVKMTTAYFLAKEEIPFSKFQGLINLQRKNGLELTSTYSNNKTCTEMVSVIGKMFKKS